MSDFRTSQNKGVLSQSYMLTSPSLAQSYRFAFRIRSHPPFYNVTNGSWLVKLVNNDGIRVLIWIAFVLLIGRIVCVNGEWNQN
jgi:hypothetical protein